MTKNTIIKIINSKNTLLMMKKFQKISQNFFEAFLFIKKQRSIFRSKF